MPIKGKGPFAPLSQWSSTRSSLPARPQTRQGPDGPKRPFKSHETCPSRHRCGQTPAGHPRPSPHDRPNGRPWHNGGGHPDPLPFRETDHQDMPSLHDDKMNERTASPKAQAPRTDGRKTVLSSGCFHLAHVRFLNRSADHLPRWGEGMTVEVRRYRPALPPAKAGGAGPDRRQAVPAKQTNRPANTDPKGWWSRTGSNRRPEACKATALPTELRPRTNEDRDHPAERRRGTTRWPPDREAIDSVDAEAARQAISGPPIPLRFASGSWWA